MTQRCDPHVAKIETTAPLRCTSCVSGKMLLYCVIILLRKFGVVETTFSYSRGRQTWENMKLASSLAYAREVKVFRFEVCSIFCFNFVCYSRGMLTNVFWSPFVRGAIVPSKNPSTRGWRCCRETLVEVKIRKVYTLRILRRGNIAKVGVRWTQLPSFVTSFVQCWREIGHVVHNCAGDLRNL